MNPLTGVKIFLDDSKRVLGIAKKPKMSEYSDMVRVVGISLIILSLIGFIVFLFFTLTKIGGAA